MHLIYLWHHPRTRCLRNVAVVTIAAQNALSEKAPKYLKLNAGVHVVHAELLLLSFLLSNSVPLPTHSLIPLVPHHSRLTMKTAGKFMKARFLSLIQHASPRASSPSSVSPLMIHFPSIMRITQVQHHPKHPVLTILPLRNTPIEMLIHLQAIP